MADTTPLHVVINAQLSRPGRHGGVEQFTEGLVRALRALPESPEHYTVLVAWDQPDRFQSIMGGSIVRALAPRPPGLWRERLKCRLGPLRQAAGSIRRFGRSVRRVSPQAAEVELPDRRNLIAALNADVLHFPYQDFFRSGKPYIYMPHDLQHLHFPQFFTPSQIASRERVYGSACREAAAVAIEASWVRDDLVAHYQIAREKIFTIPWGSPSLFWPPVTASVTDRVRKRLGITGPFALYPAQTWPHKNHLRLIDAVALNREVHGVEIPVLCTGGKNANWPVIRRHLRASGVANLVRFTGFVDESELATLYSLATMLVFPSLLEGGGFPVLESLSIGLPVACSAIPALLEYGGGACMSFDPQDTVAIADSMRKLWGAPALRDELAKRGKMRAAAFSWDSMARTYRALYRKLGGHQLTEEDRALVRQANALGSGQKS